MSGSSAIIVAAFKALMQYFGLTLEDLNLNLNSMLNS
jgi:mevalonate kinase